MKKFSNFEGFTKSEMKRIEKFAQRRDGRDSELAGWCANCKPDECGFVEVTCDICSHGMSESEKPVVMEVCMWDRRRSFIAVLKSA